MTIKEKYEKMKMSLRETNESWGWGQDYVYLIMYATFEMCRENLKQIRYAVTQKFFGWC